MNVDHHPVSDSAAGLRRTVPGGKKGIALVTGASSGIGAEIAELLGADGYDLCLVARDPARLRAVADRLTATHGVRCSILPTDLADPDAPRRIHEMLPQVDVLINNAAFGVYGSFVSTDVHSELDMIQVNITGLTLLAKLYLPGMIERRHGRILNVASMAGLLPGPYMAVYYATKAYVLSFSEALSAEVEGTGVTVTTYCPGATRTRFEGTAGADQSGLYRGRVMDPKDVARIGYRGLMQGKRTIFAGLQNCIMAASSRMTPRQMLLRMSKSWNKPLAPVA